MSRMTPRILTLLTAATISVAAFVPRCNAQVTELNIESCFNPELQKKVDYTSDMRLALATLAQINSDNYDEKKKDASLAAVFKFVPVSLKYGELETQRQQYFELNKLDLNYYRSVSLSTRTLDSAAYDLIKDCIDKVANSTYGFHYITYTQGPDKAAIQFFWNSTPGGPAELKVTDSYLEGATTPYTAKTSYPDKVFPYVYSWSWTAYPRISSAGPTILLDRTARDKIIRINLTTTPQVKIGRPIEILPVPIPTVEPVCSTVYEQNEPITGAPYVSSQVWNDNDVSDRNSHWTVAIDTPGKIYRHYCYVDEHVYIDDQGGDGTTHAYCTGHQDANPKYIHLQAWYVIGRQVCTFPQPQAH